MRILVPTDFSVFSKYAIGAAILLAKRTTAQVDLLHSYETIDGSEVESRYLEEIRERDAAELLKSRSRLSQEGIEGEDHILKGRFIKNLIRHCGVHEYDLVIMGSHGSSGLEKLMVGSNTLKALRKLNMSLLVVKQEVKNLIFDEVLFVTGLNEEDKGSFKYFLDFVNVLDFKKVHVMAVDSPAYFTQPTIVMLEALKDFEAIAKDYPVESHFYSDYSIAAGVRHFVEEYRVGLIAISNKQKSPLKRIFQGSNVEAIISSSSVPVLSIDS